MYWTILESSYSINSSQLIQLFNWSILPYLVKPILFYNQNDEAVIKFQN